MCEDEENWVIKMEPSPKFTKDIEMIQSMCNVGFAKAWRAYVDNDQDVVKAIESLFEKPVVSGEKYIPGTPQIDTGMTPEQEERCKRGRWLQDKVNAVFSVAHSKTLSDPPALQDAVTSSSETQEASQEEQTSQPSSSSSSQDCS
jgi:hypothetical protein